MPRVVHFEIVTDDPERAMRFYGGVFGWTFSPVEGHAAYWRVRTGEPGEPGIDGGLTRRWSDATGPGPGGWTCTVEVPALDGYAERIVACGGSIAVSRFAIVGVGFMLHARDPDGNVVGLIERSR